ncbi:ISLre2 family transposase [Oribacterium sp. P6A1]|uniref:ISLre2 family transposase n=3 Tax=Oribacterium sp. P6A1 TaxID=1410612 RepID=UPI00068E0CA3|nr:ISLre2 family transposase [Oribacterium sp. P6A1]
MFSSIQLFEEQGIKNLRKVEDKFIETKDIASFVNDVKTEALNLAMNIIAETLERYDEEIRKSTKRKDHWSIIRTDVKSLITSIGTINFKKTFYKNRDTGERAYLLDRELGIEEHQRITEDAEAQLLKEAVQTTYKKGGEAVSILDKVSKTTTMDKIRELDFSKVHKVPEKLREVPYLYIDADEDHVSLQFHQKKGDLKKNSFGRKDNCILAKMVYVYEGIEPESPKSTRHKLINPHYFCGVYDGNDNEKLWQEVYDYLEETYDLSKVEKVYLNSDGGAWISGAKKRLSGLTRVLDEFHMNKYMLKITGGLLDSADEVRNDLMHEIRRGTMESFANKVLPIANVAPSESAANRIIDSANYILHNWTAAKARLCHDEHRVGCSAEGHVSHVLSDRMSSRPLGWCREGANQMAHLRAYYFNHGDMLELVKAQKLPKAAGAEDSFIMDPKQIGEKIHKEWGKYVDRANHEVSVLGQKYAWFKAQITHI